MQKENFNFCWHYLFNFSRSNYDRRKKPCQQINLLSVPGAILLLHYRARKLPIQFNLPRNLIDINLGVIEILLTFVVKFSLVLRKDSRCKLCPLR